MKKHLIVLSAMLIFIFCGNNKPAPVNNHDQAHNLADAHEHHDATVLHVSRQKQREWGIVIDTPQTQEITSELILPGVISLNLNETAHISSFVEGKVVSLSADLGDRVKKGQTIITINSPEFAKAQAAFLEAKAKFELSQKEYRRAEMLFKEKAIEEKEYLRRKAENERLATEYGAYGSALHSFGLNHEQINHLIKKCEAMKKEGFMCELADPFLPILSSLSGAIIFRDVIIGEHIYPDKILFTVSNLQNLWVLLDAYEKDLVSVSNKSGVTIISSLYPEKEFRGKVTYISDTIDEKLRKILIRAEIKNTEGLLKPNMYIRGVIADAQTKRQALVLPQNAVQNLEGEKIVFIHSGGDHFVPRHIQVGHKIGKTFEIISGINGKDRIVIQGAFALKSEMTKVKFGHVHVH